MKRDEIRDLGLSDEQVDKIMALHGKDVEAYKAQITAAKDAAAAKDTELQQIREAGNPEELQTKITDLEAQIAGLATKRRDDYIKARIADKYHDPDLVLAQIVKDHDLQLDDAKGIEGLDKILAEYNTARPYMVKTTEPAGQTQTQTAPFFSAAVKASDTKTSPNDAANAALRHAIIGKEE